MLISCVNRVSNTATITISWINLLEIRGVSYWRIFVRYFKEISGKPFFISIAHAEHFWDSQAPLYFSLSFFEGSSTEYNQYLFLELGHFS